MRQLNRQQGIPLIPLSAFLEWLREYEGKYVIDEIRNMYGGSVHVEFFLEGYSGKLPENVVEGGQDG